MVMTTVMDNLKQFFFYLSNICTCLVYAKYLKISSKKSVKQKKFEKEIEPYHHSKATVGFALDKPLPLPLIKKMVAFRVAEQRTKNT